MSCFAHDGYGVRLDGVREGKQNATVVRRDETMKLEWVTDSAFRFFPLQPDELFGYVLDPVDLAMNKPSSAADRRVPRDVVDLVLIHENILPLGAVLCGAVGKFSASRRSRCLPKLLVTAASRWRSFTH